MYKSLAALVATLFGLCMVVAGIPNFLLFATMAKQIGDAIPF